MNSKDKQIDLDIWREYIKNFLERCVANLRHDGKDVLEIGRGDSTEILQNSITNLKILDKRDDIKSDYNINIFDKNLNNVVTQKFDLIFLVEVLEHTEKPWEVEKIIKTLLKPNGKLVITVPSFLWWHPLQNRYGDYWRFLPGHVPNIFPNMNILHQEVEQSDYARPLGMCYILENL